MSAAGRGDIARMEADFYATPEDATLPFLKECSLFDKPLHILEPCAGDGLMCEHLLKRNKENTFSLIELRKEEEDTLKKYSDDVHIGSFLSWTPPEGHKRPDVIITNPPYLLAEQFIRHAIDIYKGEVPVIMLLRLNFFGSGKRYAFWQKHEIKALYPLPDRPSFIDVCKGRPKNKSREAIKTCGMKYYKTDNIKVCTKCGCPVGAGTDATEYAWFVWGNNVTLPPFTIIPPKPKKKKKADK